MKAKHVETKKTVIKASEFRDMLRETLKEANGGVNVPERMVSLLTAQSALETGHWEYLWNWNFGNTKASEKTEGMFMNLRNVREVDRDGKERWYSPEGEIDDRDGELIGDRYPVPPGHPATRFRAYEDARKGLIAWLGVLSSKFPRSWAAAMGGVSPTDYAKALKSEQYYSGSETGYAAQLEKLALQYGIPEDVPTLPGNLQVGAPEFERDRRRWVLPLFFSESE